MQGKLLDPVSAGREALSVLSLWFFIISALGRVTGKVRGEMGGICLCLSSPAWEIWQILWPSLGLFAATQSCPAAVSSLGYSGLGAEQPQALLSLSAVPMADPCGVPGATKGLPGDPSRGRQLEGAPGCALTLCFWLPGDVLPSPNVGLPAALVPRAPPGPAYVTHTGPLVRLLLARAGPGRAARAVRAVRAVQAVARVSRVTRVARVARVLPDRPHTAPQGTAEPSAERGTGSGTAGIQEPSTGTPAGPAPPLPGVTHRIVFARKSPSAVLPWSNSARPSRRD